jgi:hypothetical protein
MALTGRIGRISCLDFQTIVGDHNQIIEKTEVPASVEIGDAHLFITMA